MAVYETILAEMEKEQARNARLFKSFRRSVSNQMYFLRERAKTADREEFEKINYAYGILNKIVEQVAREAK